MEKRPLSVTLVGYLFVVAGVFGFIYHLTDFRKPDAFAPAVLFVLAVRLLALVAGVFMLRGAGWARWLALAWLAYHVVLSAFHSTSQLITHVLILAAVAWLLLRPSSRIRAA